MAQPILWAGIDAGKAAHHCVAINTDGQRVLSRRVVNDEVALIDLIRAVKELADGGSVRWAIDLNSGGAAMLITLLLDDNQDLLYIPGRTVHHASILTPVCSSMRRRPWCFRRSRAVWVLDYPFAMAVVRAEHGGPSPDEQH